MKGGTVEDGEAPESSAPKQAVNRGISIADLVLRVCAAIGTLASALTMGTTSQTLPTIFSSFVQFRAQFNDIPSFTFFVIANATVCAYLVLSLALSIFHVLKSTIAITRAILITLDSVMLALLMSGASAAASIVYLAHEGNASANWSGICQQYNSFCEQISGSLIGSFLAAIALIVLITLSAMALAQH